MFVFVGGISLSVKTLTLQWHFSFGTGEHALQKAQLLRYVHVPHLVDTQGLFDHAGYWYFVNYTAAIPDCSVPLD